MVKKCRVAALGNPISCKMCYEKKERRGKQMKAINFKKTKGITLIALIITIIIMLILAGVSITVGMDSVKHSRVVKFVSYMQILQRKVDEIAETNNYSMLGTQISETGKQSTIENILSIANTNGEIQPIITSNYRYFNSTDISTILGIDNIEDEIVVNFETREVVSLNGIEYKSKMYYTQYLLPTGQKIISKTSAPAYRDLSELSLDIETTINGLDAILKISNIPITNATLSYKEKNEENWNIVTNATKLNEEKTVEILKTGIYSFKLEDNTNPDNSKIENVKILLGNAPELPEGWVYTKEEYNYSELIDENTEQININQISDYTATAQDTQRYTYYWIPRFAYKIEDGNRIIKLIKGSSLIATDNTTISLDRNNAWTIPEEFSDTGELGFLEKTGIWLKTSENIQNLFN